MAAFSLTADSLLDKPIPKMPQRIIVIFKVHRFSVDNTVLMVNHAVDNLPRPADVVNT